MPHTLVQRGTVTVPPRRFCPLSSSSSSFSSSSSSLDTPPTFPVARRPLPPPRRPSPTPSANDSTPHLRAELVILHGYSDARVSVQ